MPTPRKPIKNASQGGFSLVELLMTAFVLAVGILGLTMLQVMSLQASRGGRSLTTAVQLADRVLDQVELEGRLTWLNRTDTQYTNPVAITTLSYVGTAAAVTQTFNIKGQIPNPLATDPADKDPFFTVITTQLARVDAAPIGQMHDYTVRVEFKDAVDNANTAVTRSVTLTRRILHA